MRQDLIKSEILCHSFSVPAHPTHLSCLVTVWLSVLTDMDLCFLQAICDVSLAQISDVDRAVAAAKEAFEEGEWGKMNPRDRGRLIYKSVSFQLS